MSIPESPILENYLSLFKVREKEYIIGVYQEGITLYKQQIRTLNIFYSLVKQKIIDLENPNFHIGIVGAGVAGLTFASAALKAGIIVTVIERESKYLHLQYGCDIRKIHPNVYDWPEKNSLFPYAKLPILSWKYESASNVAKQIAIGFENIRTEFPQNNHVYLNAEFELTKEENEGRKVGKITSSQANDPSKKNTFTLCYDLIIYAVGYGVEEGAKMKTPSYWRNDDLNQIRLSATKKKIKKEKSS